MARILVIDDEKMICEEFSVILQEENHQVDIALGGEEALQKIRKSDYDIIFLDVLMPHMEGREVFDKIKKIKNIPVAIMSGYMPPNKEKEVLELGAIACLKKPFELERIRSLLRSIEEKNQTDSHR